MSRLMLIVVQVVEVRTSPLEGLRCTSDDTMCLRKVLELFDLA